MFYDVYYYLNKIYDIDCSIVTASDLVSFNYLKTYYVSNILILYPAPNLIVRKVLLFDSWNGTFLTLVGLYTKDITMKDCTINKNLSTTIFPASYPTFYCLNTGSTPHYYFSIESLDIITLLLWITSNCMVGTKLRVKSHYRGHKMALWLHLIPQLHRPGAAPRHHQFRSIHPDMFAGQCYY